MFVFYIIFDKMVDRMVSNVRDLLICIQDPVVIVHDVIYSGIGLNNVFDGNFDDNIVYVDVKNDLNSLKEKTYSY